jgi:hypothetical protein
VWTEQTLEGGHIGFHPSGPIGHAGTSRPVGRTKACRGRHQFFSLSGQYGEIGLKEIRPVGSRQ